MINTRNSIRKSVCTNYAKNAPRSLIRAVDVRCLKYIYRYSRGVNERPLFRFMRSISGQTKSISIFHWTKVAQRENLHCTCIKPNHQDKYQYCIRKYLNLSWDLFITPWKSPYKDCCLA